MSHAGDIVPRADLHCHLLPDWDDGPRTLDESLRMAERAAEAGMQKILVTPHVGRATRSRPEKAARDIPQATADLQEQLRERGIPLELVPGAEVALVLPDWVERLESEPFLSVNGQSRYVLLESTTAQWPSFASGMIYEAGLRGVTTIIAHPERYLTVQRDIGCMRTAVERGAVLQITARSLLKGADRGMQRCAWQLLQAGLVAVIASDAHSREDVLPAAVVDTAVSAVGIDMARRILIDNPERILSGQPLPEPPARPGGRAGEKSSPGLLGWLWKRRVGMG